MSNIQELIRAARAAIGEGNSDTDWKIVPTEHAKLFEEKAASLKRMWKPRPLGGEETFSRLEADPDCDMRSAC